jgi:polyhydroxyalkanoate synthesis regulator phasin
MQQREQMRDAYLNALAGRLGLSVDQLKAAMQQSRIDLINQAVADGKLTQEQADRRIQAIQSGQHPGGMRPGAGNQRPGMGQHGPGQGQRGPGGPGGMRFGAGQEVATILGMTPQELRTELRSGKSLAQVGEAKGISRDTLKAKLLEAHQARLDAAVAAGKLTAEQAQKMTERAAANIDRMLDRTPGQRRGPQAPGGGA